MASMDLPIRPRRVRMNASLRDMLGETRLQRGDFILPVFVTEGKGVRNEVASMPGVFQMSVDVARDWLADRAGEGFKAFIVFGVIARELKDERGSVALDEGNVVCRLLREVKKSGNPMAAMTDLCFCEYTRHGHCGLMSVDRSTVKNDETVELLVKQALNHAKAGADVIAPSGMMDGTVGALRKGLDAAGFERVAILAYSVKYASAFYGPFRDAADSAPEFGDRKSYQMDPAGRVDEAIREAKLDVEQGADLVMVKPALAYLDVIRAVKQTVKVPVIAYQVSGEYAMIEAAARNGWIDRDHVLIESLTAMKRAGASAIITYYGDKLPKLVAK